MMFCILLPPRSLPVMMAIMAVGGLVLAPLAEGRLDESAHDRIIFWGQANEAFKRTPLFGVGLGLIDEFIQGGRAPHNAYVLCYAETGVFGYCAWFSLLFVGLLGVWRTRRLLATPRNEEELWLKQFTGSCLAAVVGFAGSGYFLGRAFVYPMFLLFAVMGVVPVIANRLRPGSYRLLIRPRFDVTLSTILAVLSILYIYCSILILNRLGYVD
jgi:O-antigen ligase